MELDIGRDAAHDGHAEQWIDWTWSDEEQQAWNATFHVDYEALGLDPSQSCIFHVTCLNPRSIIFLNSYATLH